MSSTAVCLLDSYHGVASVLDGGFEDLECIIPATLETCLCRLPVDDFPDILNVRSFAVEILSHS